MSGDTLRWRHDRLPDKAWKASPGLSPAARSTEQDQAAGGHDTRLVTLVDRECAVGSIALRLYPKSRRVRAYLRWSDRGRTRERYVGEVTADNRKDNLAHAWRLVAERGLTDQATEGHRTRAPMRTKQAKESWATSEAVRAVMKANRGRDTRPELALRSAAHALGLRYRVNTRPLPKLRRTADLVFPRLKVAVFLDGCFWHGCPQHFRPSKLNESFWTAKITDNRKRDQDTDRQLAQAGWTVIRIWEHADPAEAAQRIASIVRGDTPSSRSPSAEEHPTNPEPRNCE
jgi:DNA mismatch endonuclease (patch repair protein)